MILLASQYHSSRVRLGDSELNGAVGPQEPKGKGGNSDPYQRKSPTRAFVRVLQETDKEPNRAEERCHQVRSVHRPVPGQQDGCGDYAPFNATKELSYASRRHSRLLPPPHQQSNE